MTDRDQVERLVSEVSPDVIVHLAAVIPPWIYRDPELGRKVNVDATATLVRAAETQPKPPLFLHAVSAAVYGWRNPLPPCRTGRCRHATSAVRIVWRSRTTPRRGEPAGRWLLLLADLVALAGLDGVRQLRSNLEQVAHDTEVGDLEIGASSSLLTATIVLEVCMPARCWIAPEMPSAMYSCGDTSCRSGPPGTGPGSSRSPPRHAMRRQLHRASRPAPRPR